MSRNQKQELIMYDSIEIRKAEMEDIDQIRILFFETINHVNVLSEYNYNKELLVEKLIWYNLASPVPWIALPM